MFKLQSPSKYSAFDAIYVSRPVFTTSQHTFWICQFWCLLMLLPFFVFCFVFSLFPIGKAFPFEDFFHLGKQKLLLRWDQVNMEDGAPGSCHFWSKISQHSVWCGQVRSVYLQITHHEMGKYVERVFKKNSPKTSVASHNNASWYMTQRGF